MKTLTIVIPAYNAHQTIIGTLGSIVMQTKKDDIHCIIVDDCSELFYDNIIFKFNQLLDIELIRLPYNQGPSYARNEGLKKVQTPYVMFMDADDNLIHPYVVENLLNPLLEDPKGYMIISDFIEHDESNCFNNIKQQDCIWTFGKIYKVDYLRKHNIFFGQYNQNEDTAFNLECRLAASEEDFIYTLQDVTYSWNFLPKAITKINNCEYTYTTSTIGAIGNIKNVLLKYKNNANDLIFYNENLLLYLISAYCSYNQMLYLNNGYDKELLKVSKEYYQNLIDNDEQIFHNKYVNFEDIYGRLLFQHHANINNYILISFNDFIKLLK